MRIVWLVFLTLLGRFACARRPEASPTSASASVAAPARPTAYVVAQRRPARADSIVAFALRQIGTPYCYAGTSPETGFDCSGFVHYVFGRYRVPVPHATALLISTGQEVDRSVARPGDIVVFTGTAATSTTPGHAGIVISWPGQPLRFVHSSSAKRDPGVKISQVEGTDYERRFMSVRRVL